MNNNSLSIAIQKDVLHTLPPLEYQGGISVVDTVEQARVALRELRRHRLIGFDTETRPSFRKGHTHKVALMQLATDDFCFLFRLNKLGVFDALKDFLEDGAITKVGLSVHDDFNVLRRSCPDLDPKGFIELQSYVKGFGITDISLQKIYAIVFGQYISKNQRLTNWEAAELTSHQQCYAATDAWACLKIYRHLQAGKFDPEQSPYRVVPEDKDELMQLSQPAEIK